MNKSRKPTRTEVEAKPTKVSDDIFCGRSFWQHSSDTQELPQGDNRYRVTHSVKFYVVQLIGTWVHVSESAERSVKYRANARWVRFENKEYELRKADRFKSILTRFLQGGCYAYIGSKQVNAVNELNLI